MHFTTLVLEGLLLLGQAHQAALDITAANGRLTVHVSGAPLRDVVREIARLTRIHIVGEDRLTGPISEDFIDLPAKEALGRVLAHVNYVMKVPQTPAATRGELAIYIHSMVAPETAGAFPKDPIRAPALEALVSLDADEAADERETEDDDPDDDVRREQRFTLERLAGRGAFEASADTRALIKLSDDHPDAAIRLRALQVLAGRPLDRVLLDALLRALDDDSFDVRSAAVGILGRGTDAGSLEAVGRLLDHGGDEERLQVSALRVIALRADAASIPHLQTLANAKDGDRDRREAANQIIAELLDRKAKQTR